MKEGGRQKTTIDTFYCGNTTLMEKGNQNAMEYIQQLFTQLNSNHKPFISINRIHIGKGSLDFLVQVPHCISDTVSRARRHLHTWKTNMLLVWLHTISGWEWKEEQRAKLTCTERGGNGFWKKHKVTYNTNHNFFCSPFLLHINLNADINFIINKLY